MKTMYCWRCRIDVPMLDEAEYKQLAATYSECMRARPDAGLGGRQLCRDGDLNARFAPVRALYAQLTGGVEMYHNAAMHHRISLYGPPCTSCGKPLRTPKAAFCAACGVQAPDPVTRAN